MSPLPDLSILKSIGLDEEEIKTYLALLERGPQSIRSIATYSGVNRGTTYESLKHLVSLGLVGYSVKNVRGKYWSESPERLKLLAEEKQKETATALSRVNELVPQLTALTPHLYGDPIVRFYEDDDGIVTILRDVLATAARLTPKEYYVYSSRPLRAYLYRRFPNFTRRRIKEGVFVKVIAIGQSTDPVEFAERKEIPEPVYGKLSSYTLIYGNKVALVAVSPNETPYGVVIEEPGVAEMQKYLFEKLWESLK